MSVEVLEVKGLRKEGEFWMAEESIKEFSVVVKLGKRKREIKFRRCKRVESKGEARFFSDLVHEKFVDELVDKLEDIDFDVEEVWMRHSFADIEVWGIISDGRVWI